MAGFRLDDCPAVSFGQSAPNPMTLRDREPMTATGFDHGTGEADGDGCLFSLVLHQATFVVRAEEQALVRRPACTRHLPFPMFRERRDPPPQLGPHLGLGKDPIRLSLFAGGGGQPRLDQTQLSGRIAKTSDLASHRLIVSGVHLT